MSGFLDIYGFILLVSKLLISILYVFWGQVSREPKILDDGFS